MNTAMIIMWAAILIGTVIVEILTEQFVSIWFSVASVFSLILAGLKTPVWLQLVVFTAVSLILIFATRPLVKKLKKVPQTTNFEMNIGKTAVITEAIGGKYSHGRATLDGVSWMAVTEDDTTISPGEKVRVLDVSGAKLIVTKING